MRQDGLSSTGLGMHEGRVRTIGEGSGSPPEFDHLPDGDRPQSSPAGDAIPPLPRIRTLSAYPARMPVFESAQRPAGGMPGYTRAEVVDQPTEFAAVPDEMLAEARQIVGTAATEGVVLRLVGSLAVLATSPDRGFARRPIRDIDLVGLRRQAKRVAAPLEALRYQENRHVRFATAGQVLQFYRRCTHLTSDGRYAHEDDRIDVYLDAFRLDHEIALKDRLPSGTDAVPAADVLLIKLQRSAPSSDDLRDVVALLKDLRLDRRDEPGVVNLDYLAQLCSRDWCLHHDVTGSLRRCRERLAEFELNPAEQARVAAALDELEQAIAGRAKSLRWRLRSLPGERLPWTDGVDEREGLRLGLLEGGR